MSTPGVGNRAHLSVVEEDPGPVSPDSRVLEHQGLGGIDQDFVEVYTTHYPRLVRALELGGTTHTNAEDIAQEAFARTLGHWRRVRRGSNPAGYVYRVAFRLSRRSRTSERSSDIGRDSVDVADEATLHVGIDAAMAKMPPAQRRCAVMCLVIGMSTKEAAAALHIAESTVRKQIERARVDLHSALAEE
jgi:RNA polymerase sigma-70 factor (ECF subfamily)